MKKTDYLSHYTYKVRPRYQAKIANNRKEMGDIRIKTRDKFVKWEIYNTFDRRVIITFSKHI